MEFSFIFSLNVFFLSSWTYRQCGKVMLWQTVSLDSIRYTIKVSKHIAENEKNCDNRNKCLKLELVPNHINYKLKPYLNIFFKILALLHCSSIHILTI